MYLTREFNHLFIYRGTIMNNVSWLKLPSLSITFVTYFGIILFVDNFVETRRLISAPPESKMCLKNNYFYNIFSLQVKI